MPNNKSVQQIQIRAVPIFISSLGSEFISFIKWWYTEIPIWQVKLFKRVAIICDDTLSISLLLKTFFIPWHRDPSIIGRALGVIIRILYLPIAIIITTVLLTLVVAFMFIWITLPGIFIFNFINSLPQ